ncbi:hypothetical protein [Conexibacter woesei]|uniref:hypothetical protein n=1 Tax=Conexibacter woesei TaxID=191495 RepID=UPI0012DCC379|nr:hypothetical protein [Conexibacter woesei]
MHRLTAAAVVIVAGPAWSSIAGPADPSAARASTTASARLVASPGNAPARASTRLAAGPTRSATAGDYRLAAGPVRPSPRRPSTAAGFRLVGAPVVLVQSTGDSGDPYFQVRVRMNRALPVGRQGVRANFLVGRSGSDDAPSPFGIRSRHCYVSAVGNDVPDPALAHARPGSKVRLTVEIAGHPRIVRTVTLRSPHYVKLRTLGCGVRR